MFLASLRVFAPSGPVILGFPHPLRSQSRYLSLYTLYKAPFISLTLIEGVTLHYICGSSAVLQEGKNLLPSVLVFLTVVFVAHGMGHAL